MSSNLIGATITQMPRRPGTERRSSQFGRSSLAARRTLSPKGLPLPLSRLASLPRVAALLLLTLTAAGCSMGGGSLSPGLSARMDAPGARLNTAEAIGIVNQYRATVGAGPLTEDPALNATAQALAAQYARTGKQSPKPAGTIEIRYSAGYANFAETFSGWRGAPQTSEALSGRSATRAGIASVYEASSPYGVYWVMIVG